MLKTYVHVFQNPTADPSQRPTPQTRVPPPVLLLLHGTGGDEHELLNLGEKILPVAPLLSLRGNVSEAGMPRFFRRIAPGVFDIDDALRRAGELAAFITAARTHYELGSRPIIAVGYSNGANIAHCVLLRHPRILQGAILLRPMVVLPPPDTTALAGTPVLLLCGANDPTVPKGQPEQLATRIATAGGDPDLRYTAQSHGLVQQDIREAREWLAETAL